MRFTPFQKYTLYTQLSVSDARQRLQRSLDSPKKWFTFQLNNPAYDGEIEGDEFTIFQVGRLRVPLLPDIKGRISTANEKTVIDVFLKIYKWEFALGACAACFMLVCFAGILWSNWSSTHNLKVTAIAVLVITAAFSLMYSIITLNYIVASNRSKKFLRRLLEAE